MGTGLSSTPQKPGRTRRVAGSILLLLALVLPASPASGSTTARVPVLMYHRISCAERGALLPSLWVCPSRFDRHLRALREAGWRTITARRLMRHLKQGDAVPERTLVIVIDDGDRDGFDNAYPILEKHGFVATYAVVVARVGRHRSAMSWDELRELVANGHEIASHTMHHDDVRRESAAGLEYEIGASGRTLERKLGIPTRTFVYPYGLWDAAAVAVVRAHGYWGAFTTAWGCTMSWSDRLLEERVRINGSDGPAQVLAKVRGC